MDVLATCLLELIVELDQRSVTVMIGGGYGLFLKRQHLLTTGSRTLFQSLPETRATNDIDLFLRAELLADLDRTRELRDAIGRLGYEPVEAARYMQWSKRIEIAGVPQEVKIDVLVGPLGDFRSKLHVSMPRVRPRGEIEFHAHAVEEAVFIEERPISIAVSGKRSDGSETVGKVEVPEAFPYLMMKLHAYADRREDENKDLGRHHALDAYSIVGMMTEPEYERAVRIGREQARNPNVERARELVRQDFSTESGLGMLRLREHRLFRPDLQLEEFRQVLREIFGNGEATSAHPGT